MLADPSGDESGAATQHSILDTTSIGRINVNDCARLRGLTHTGETRNRNPIFHPTQLTFFPAYPEDQTPTTPRRRIVSLPPHLGRQRSASESGSIGSPPHISHSNQSSPSQNEEQTRDFTFALRTAYFTPKPDESTPSSPTTVSSLTITQPTPTLQNTSSTLPIMTSREHPRTVPLFKGDYGDKEEPTEWFAQFELSLLETWTDRQRIDRFAMQLAPGQIAEEWFQGLSSLRISTFLDLRTAFRKRWPPPKRPKYSRMQQKERVMAEVLDENDIGLWTAGNYGHVVWATKVSRLALGMGDMEGYLIEYVIEAILNLLKDYLKCEYADWDEFVEDVQSVSSVKLKRGREDLDKERVRDVDIARLKAQPSLASLQYLFSQMSTSSQWSNPPAYRATTRTPTLPSQAAVQPNVTGIMYPTLNSAPLMPAPNALGMLMGTGRGGFGMRGAPFTRVQLTRAQIMEKLAMAPQRANTEAGVRQYEADIELWHRNHGTEGFSTLDKPYPLRPGTALIGSGECYSCGVVTDPPHVGAQCIAQEHLKPQESRWRQQVAGLLRRTALQMKQPAYSAAPVQYVAPATHPYYGSYGTPSPAPVYVVAQQEEHNGLDGQDAWTTQEPGYDWRTENYMGPLPQTDQQ